MSEDYVESKIIFEEGDKTRALRGEITEEDTLFITLKRKDGIFRIAKRMIIKIEQLNNRGSGSD
jgi:hypothetical protein